MDRTHWPLDFSMWIAYIRDKAQIPEYHAVIACQEIRKRDIIERTEKAERFFEDQVMSMIDVSAVPEDIYPAIKSLYANTVFNLEGWGFSSDQVADILFKDWKKSVGRKEPQVCRDIVSILHDYQLETVVKKNEVNIPDQDSTPDLPLSIQKYVIDALYKAGLSETGIKKITGIKNINFGQDDVAETLLDD